MTKIEDFRKFLADMDDLNGRLDALAREASDASAVRAALLRRGKAAGLTIASVDQMLANVRVDYRPPVDADADPDVQDGGALLAPTDGADGVCDGAVEPIQAAPSAESGDAAADVAQRALFGEGVEEPIGGDANIVAMPVRPKGMAGEAYGSETAGGSSNE